jgi:hypothetical protein
MCCASHDATAGQRHADTDRPETRGSRDGACPDMTLRSPTIVNAKNGMPRARAGGIGLFESPSTPTFTGL